MTEKRVIRLKAAREDERDATAYYAREAGLEVALRFTDALRDAYRAIGARPDTGSPRFGELLKLPGLRARTVGCFPYLIFYKEGVDGVDVWRILHARSDIPAWLFGDEE